MRSSFRLLSSCHCGCWRSSLLPLWAAVGTAGAITALLLLLFLPPSSSSWEQRASALTQDFPVELRDPVWVHRPRQEVGEALVPPGPGSVPGAAVLVERHEVEGASVSVAVDVGGVGVVPVLFKLLPEHTLRREPRLQMGWEESVGAGV